MREQLRAGRKVELPGVGVFQVVLIAAHRDLVNGIPAVVPARSVVEFVPTADLNATANTPGGNTRANHSRLRVQGEPQRRAQLEDREREGAAQPDDAMNPWTTAPCCRLIG